MKKPEKDPVSLEVIHRGALCLWIMCLLFHYATSSPRLSVFLPVWNCMHSSSPKNGRILNFKSIPLDHVAVFLYFCLPCSGTVLLVFVSSVEPLHLGLWRLHWLALIPRGGDLSQYVDQHCAVRMGLATGVRWKWILGMPQARSILCIFNSPIYDIEQFWLKQRDLFSLFKN